MEMWAGNRTGCSKVCVATQRLRLGISGSGSLNGSSKAIEWLEPQRLRARACCHMKTHMSRTIHSKDLDYPTPTLQQNLSKQLSQND
eukprot:5972609-Amphidinium_carterae.1